MSITTISDPPHSTVPLCDDAPLPRWKRTLDLACCLFNLPFLVALAGWGVLWLALTSPGPLFFKQERVGFRGRRFQLYKFRTMHVGVESASHQAHTTDLVRGNGPMHKLDAARDTRLIPGSWLMRASGLDELPQIINVLRGEMSFVGPRPCIPYEYEQYSPWHRERLNSVPGLTGLWQVSGKNRTTFDEMVCLDIAYGQSKSLALDLAIMVRTPMALVIQIIDTRLSRLRRAVAAQAAPPRERAATTVRTESAT
jgi:lipopolysaccharide/colanic/teichoic acid biosynthesis glycosyltransferase